MLKKLTPWEREDYFQIDPLSKRWLSHARMSFNKSHASISQVGNGQANRSVAASCNAAPGERA